MIRRDRASDVSPSARIYMLLMIAYPAEFRRAHGVDAGKLFADLHASVWAARGYRGVAMLWLRSATQVIVLGAYERCRSAIVRRGRAATGLQGNGRLEQPRCYRQYPDNWATGRLSNSVRAIRSLRRSPSVGVVVVLALAAGSGFAIATFAVLDGVAWSGLPFRRPEKVVMLRGRWDGREVENAPLSSRDFIDLQSRISSFETVAAIVLGSAEIPAVDGTVARHRLGRVTADFLSTLGVTAQLGRLLEADDDRVVVLSHDLWQNRYHGNDAVIGKTIYIGGAPVTIRGVLPPGFAFYLPRTSGQVTGGIDVWELLLIDAETANYSGEWLEVFARVRETATLNQAQEEVDALTSAHRGADVYRARKGFHIAVRPIHDEVVARARSPLAALFWATLSVTVIALANAATLRVIDIEHRRRAFALRRALGCDAWGIGREVCAEGIVLAAAAGALGIGIAYGLIEILVRAELPLPRLHKVGFDARASAFAVGLVLAATISIGLVPALWGVRRSRDRPKRTTSRGVLGSSLLAIEVALALILVVAAGQLLRYTRAVGRERPGYDVDRVAALRVAAPARLLNTLEKEIRALPGVSDVGTTQALPLTRSLRTGPFVTDEIGWEHPSAPFEADWRFVSPSYFSTMGIRFLTGRPFAAREHRPVVVVDTKLAAVAWPGANALGRRLLAIPQGGQRPRWHEVIGIVEHARTELARDGRPTLYFLQAPTRAPVVDVAVYMAVRTVGRAGALIRPIDEVVARELPGSSPRARTLRSYADEMLAPLRTASTAFATLAVMAITLGVVGLYSVLLRSVRARSREIGVRLALGATAGDVRRSVLRHGALRVCIGLACGLLVVFGATWSMNPPTYQGPPLDLSTVAGAALLLAIVAGLALLAPAHHAARVDAISVLRRPDDQTL